MRKCLWLILLLSLLAGCEDDGPVTLTDETQVITWLDDLSIRLSIENNTDSSILSEFEVDIHEEWLESQIDGERKVYYDFKGNGELEKNVFRLDHRSENYYTISYDLKKQVDKYEFIEAVDHGAVEVTIRSEDGDVLANEKVRNLHVYDFDSRTNSSNGFGLLVFILLVMGLGGYFLDKAIRKWMGIPNIDREDLPKTYKRLNLGFNLLTSIITFMITFSSPSDFWFKIKLLILIYLAFQVIIDLYFLRETKEYRVTLITGLVLMLVAVTLSEFFPYMLY
ncbi:hypothetical protein [Piscibacillus halophilus]|uniref:hypothetical protein n=1 Tax=Piscibacillus halophilus TaxID=571933 RepID=UPI00158EEC5C|nr:hypothetical protein [Piscibacillus halophilus]